MNESMKDKCMCRRMCNVCVGEYATIVAKLVSTCYLFIFNACFSVSKLVVEIGPYLIDSLI